MEPVAQHDGLTVYPMEFDVETVKKFWERASEFPTLYGREILGNIDKFVELFFAVNPDGTYVPYGLFWKVVSEDNDLLGVFYLTELRGDSEDSFDDANAHYTFFDRRHHGREPLVKQMLQFWFEKYKFRRLSAEIPNFVTPQARHFAQECGMSYEGKRRKAAKYKNDWFDVNLYGVLREEVL